MFGCLRHWAGAGAVFTGLVCGVSAAPGYLPAVGPAALRFRPAAPSGTNLVRMALPPPDVAPTILSTPSTNTAADTEVKPATAAAPPASAALILAATNTPPQQEAAPFGSEPLISPQMLLKYFNRSTNGAGSGIIAPVDFAPPPAAPARSSTATYSTGP